MTTEEKQAERNLDLEGVPHVRHFALAVCPDSAAEGGSEVPLLVLLDAKATPVYSLVLSTPHELKSIIEASVRTLAAMQGKKSGKKDLSIKFDDDIPVSPGFDVRVHPKGVDIVCGSPGGGISSVLRLSPGSAMVLLQTLGSALEAIAPKTGAGGEDNEPPKEFH